MESRILEKDFFGWFLDTDASQAANPSNVEFRPIGKDEKVTIECTFNEDSQDFEFSPIIKEIASGEFLDILYDKKNFSIMAMSSVDKDQDEIDKAVELLFSK